MKKHLTYFLLILFHAQWGHAQKMSTSPIGTQYSSEPCRAMLNKTPFAGKNTPETIRQLLPGLVPNLQNEKVTVRLNYVHESLAGYHYSFTQLYAGIPVYQSEIKVNTDRNNTIRSIFDNSYNTGTWNLTPAADLKNAVIAIDPNTGTAVVAALSIINGHLETLSEQGAVIFQRDMNSYYPSIDSTVTGKVFNPDPLTTSQHIYTDIASTTGGDTIYYDNNNGADEPWMDAQQQTVSFKATFNDSIFTLASPYVMIAKYDTSAPNVDPVTSPTPQFYFNRSQSGFIDVNAYYHISTHRNYIAALGFHCGDSLILADTHYTNDDNSFFSPADNPRRLYFGVGGVPDAEDADVVVHEYSHSLSYNCSPGSNVGLERNSLDEAFADYNAAAYSKAISTFHDEWVYNWDGHNQYWPDRVLNSTGVYPTDLGNNIYTNGEMWSAVLFSLNGDIGRGVTDSIIYQAHYSYAQNMTMAQAAVLLIDADSLLFNGGHYCAIYERLLQHGFVPAANNGCVSGIKEVSDAAVGFAQTGNAFTIYNPDLSPLRIQLLTITGQQIAPPIISQDASYNYHDKALSTGIYLVNVISDKGSSTFKWVNLSR